MARWHHGNDLTPGQELFCQGLRKNHIASHVYREIYKCSAKSATVGATRLMKKRHVIHRLDQLRRRDMKKHEITVDKVLTDYQEALDMARERASPSEMVAAASAQAKLVGLLRERVETGHVGEFGDTTSIEGILEVVAKEAGPEAAMTLASMFGLKLPESEETRKMKEAALFIADPASDSVN